MKLETLDARVKLWMLISISSASLLFRSPVYLLCLLLFTLAILLAGGVSVKRALWRVRGVIGLIASIFVLQCLFERSGEPLIRMFHVTLITDGGLNAALYVMLRMLTVLLSALIILSGKRRDYLLALSQFGVPYEISFMVMAGQRFLPLLREETHDVLCAVQMRGMKLKGTSLKNKLSIYLRVTLPIVAGAIRRSEKLSVAMEARAFRAMPCRTSMRRLQMKTSDWWSLAVFTLILFLMIGGELWLSQ